MEGKLLTRYEREQEEIRAGLRGGWLEFDKYPDEEVLENLEMIGGFDNSAYTIDDMPDHLVDIILTAQEESHRQQIADWGYCGPEEGCETCDYDREEREEEGDD